MPNTALNRTTVIYLTNKSGAAVTFGGVVVIDVANATSFTTTVVSGYVATQVGVCVEPNGIAIDALGLIAVAGWIPRINLNVAATVSQFFKTHTVAGQATPHTPPYAVGDFGYALQATATPKAVLLGSINISTGGLALSDGDKGDITVASAGSVWTIDLNAVTYDKIQAPSTDSILLGRGDTAPGDVEEITLGTGLAMTGTVLSATAASPFTTEDAQDAVGLMVDSSLVYVDATPLLTRAALTGEVTAIQGGNALTIANNAVVTAKLLNGAVTNAKLADIATAILKGRISALTGVVEDLTVTQVTSMLNLFSSTLKGLVPLSGGGSVNYLRADGTWDVPVGSGGLSGGAADKLAIWSGASSLTNDVDLHYNSTNNNLGLGTATFGTGLNQGIALWHDSVNYPSTGMTDVAQLYAREQFTNGTGIFVRGENGGVSSLGSQIICGNDGVGLLNLSNGGLQLDGSGPLIYLSYIGAVAHGVTSLVPTSVYAAFDNVAIAGGLHVRAYTAAAIAGYLSFIGTTNPDTAKSTSANAALQFEFAKKSGTTVGAMAASVNLIGVTDALGIGNVWLLDRDGNTWQVGYISSLSQILRGATSGSLTILPAAITTDYTITWPDAQGANGSVPTNNGSGVLTWTVPSGGSYTDEQAQDAVGGMVDASLVYVDATPLLTRAAITGDIAIAQGSNTSTLSANLKTRTIPVTFDGSGSVLTTGAKKAYWSPEHSGTITKWRLLADQSGSIVVDIWKDTYANYPPTVADTITASAKPTITTAIKAESSTLTGWTTTFSAGDVFEFNIDSVTTLTKCMLMLTYTVT